MRLIPVLLISVALATSAGCFGKDDESGGDTTTTPTATGTTPTGTGGTTPTATPTSPTPGDNETTPMAPPPKELCPVSKDFSSNTPTPPATAAVSTADCGAVTAGYTKIALHGNFTSAEPLMVANAVAVKVLDGAGTAVLTCSGPSAGPQATTPCEQTGSAAAGPYTLQFEGTGNIDFAGSVSIS